MNEKLLRDVAERGARYLDELGSRPVFPRPENVRHLETALATGMPAGPTPPDDVLAFLDEFGSPATVATAGGRYFGFVTGGALPATVAAHCLATAWDQNCFSLVSSPAAHLFDATALRWLKEIFGLPAESAGAFVVGATSANFSSLAAARHEVLRRVGWNVEEQGLRGSPEITLVVGAEAHGIIFKVLPLLGFGRSHIVRVPTDDQGRMRADRLPAIKGPTIACIQAGNVNSGAFDPAPQIIEWARPGGAWVHVDGAFGLWARTSAKRAHLMEGVEAADSWATDAHKWLNVPFDCGVLFVRHATALRAAMSISGDYLLLDSRDASGPHAGWVAPRARRRCLGGTAPARAQRPCGTRRPSTATRRNGSRDSWRLRVLKS